MKYLVVLLALALGCANTNPSQSIVVPAGKADDFLSSTAAEFVVKGRATITLDTMYENTSEASRLERVKELVGYKQVGVAWFLTQYFIDKKSGDANEDFGGFSGMAKNNRFEDIDLQKESELVYSYKVEQLIAGPQDLLDVLPTELNANNQREFTLTMGNPSNDDLAKLETNNEWYRSAPYSGWNPETVDASKKVDLLLTIEPEVESNDAYFDYNALFADGELTIDVHFGWDYHDAYHIKHAESVYNWLQTQGFTAPVDSFDELDRNSGAFIKTLNANGRDVAVRVRIYYGHPDGETNPDTNAGGMILEEDIRESLGESDVIVYSGHSGPFYGFAMGNWKMTDEGDFDDSEMATVGMPVDTYQIVFAEGCDTYHIGEAFRRNPSKPDGKFIDIITTTAPSDAGNSYAVQDLISRLTQTNDDGAHEPKTVRSLINDLDRNSRWAKTMYGIHGIDDNPQLHPYANETLVCEACGSDADCGGPGNHCVNSACAPSCTTDGACGSGFSCGAIADADTRQVIADACVPNGGSC